MLGDGTIAQNMHSMNDPSASSGTETPHSMEDSPQVDGDIDEDESLEKPAEKVYKFSPNIFKEYRALVIKNVHVQRRQVWANCCQLFLPTAIFIFLFLTAQLLYLTVPTNTPNVLTSGSYQGFVNGTGVCSSYSIGDTTDSTYCTAAYYNKFYFCRPTSGDTRNPGELTKDGVASGMLGRIPQLYIDDSDSMFLPKAVYSPFMEEYDSPDKINAQIVQDIATATSMKSLLLSESWFEASYVVPEGAVLFQKLSAAADNKASAALRYTAQTPNDASFLPYVYGLSDPQYLRMQLINMVDNAFVKVMGASFSINTNVYSMPYWIDPSAEIKMAVATVSFIFLPLVFMFLLPVFMYSVVEEKQERLFEFMKIMGVRTPVYWLANYTFDMTLYNCILVVSFILGRWMVRSPFFLGDPLAALLLLIAWGHCLIGSAYLFAVFFTKARRAASAGYLIVLASAVVSVALVLGFVGTGSHYAVY